MKKVVYLLLASFLCSLSVLAQQYTIKGSVVESPALKAVEYATVALLRPDSTLVTGVHTNEKGQFQLSVNKTGTYLLKLSFVGYQTRYHRLQTDAQHSVYDLGILPLSHDEQLLGTATVTATAAKVEQVEDTTLYNAAAYRVPEGSTLEALVKQLPGIEIEDNGTITWNGKPVKEFLINGKDFFKGQIDIALQNLPSDWISKIKAYDKQSEYTEQTGIDDGEDFPVLDIVTKRELNQTVVVNSDLAYGTDERYFAKLFASRFTDHSRVSTYGSANNVSDKSFGGKRKRQGGGLVDRQNAGMDFFWANGKKKKEAGKLEMGGNVNFDHNKSHLLTRSETENYLSSGTTSSFRSSFSQNESASTHVGGNFQITWNPDTMTNLRFRPTFRYGKSSNHGDSRTATFNADPFDIDGMLSPLDSLWMDPPTPALEQIAVNKSLRFNKGQREDANVGASLNLVRRLNSKGRNLSLALSGGYDHSKNVNFSISDIYYYTDRPGRYQNQYSNMPSEKWNYRVQVGYVEPLTEHWFAELRYAFSHKYTESERGRYNLEDIALEYGTWGDSLNYPAIGTLPDADLLAMVRDSFNSQSATYRYLDHTANFNLRYNTKSIRFTAGVNFNPERTKMAYERPGQHLDTVIVRDVLVVTPQLNFRYRIDKRNSFEFRYRGSSAQPSMTDLLAVVDNSHPLNITMGNPGLKPSWNNSFDMGYRGYQTEHQRGMSVGFRFSNTKNAISHLSVYDESTGVRYHRPQNINGNWNVRGNYGFNIGLGKEKNFTLGTNTNLVYNNAVGYISSFTSGTRTGTELPLSTSDYGYYEQIFDQADIQKNRTRTFGVRERLNLGYRKDWLEVGTFGTLNYSHSRSTLRKKNDRDTWDYAYGVHTNLRFDFGLSLSTDIRVNSRRGYPNAQMNTDEWWWNAQIAYSFLKKKAATVSLQWYDILQQQSNVSHMISATRRSDSWNNAIHSYGMVHFIYKFRQVGGKKNKKNKSWKKKPGSILDDAAVMPDDL